jgi:7-keto-8-aminopelargonate synthetase-like enzyme
MQGHKDRKLELENELAVIIGKKEILLSITQLCTATSEIST